MTVYYLIVVPTFVISYGWLLWFAYRVGRKRR